jgi:OmcA/MtrC family decaheme c-type cytochrome
VNFATGQGHVNLPQFNDSACATCHIPQGELPLDASILNSHFPTDIANAGLIVPDQFFFVPGMIFSDVKVQNGTAGKTPTITFTLRDKAGNAIGIDELKVSPGRLAAVMAGPATEYGFTSFGSDVTTPGYVSEDIANGGGTCNSSGSCTYTFKHAIPADAKGTFSIGLEGRRTLNLLPGTEAAASTEYGAKNVVINFSVDGSPVTPRRTVVATANCNRCHTFLSLHGTNRNQVEQCVLCHNPSETDSSRRASATDPNDKNTPPQAVNFTYMIHRIHTGENLKDMGAGYTVVGFGGSHNDFTEVGYPAFSPSGAAGDTRNCAICHVNGSESNIPSGRAPMKNPQSPVNPTPAVTAACTGCHAAQSTLAHAMNNTAVMGGQSVEACETCHSSSSQFSVTRVHAR